MSLRSSSQRCATLQVYVCMYLCVCNVYNIYTKFVCDCEFTHAHTDMNIQHTTYIHTYIHTYTHTNTHTHTYVYTYIDTYIHTYIHKHENIFSIGCIDYANPSNRRQVSTSGVKVEYEIKADAAAVVSIQQALRQQFSKVRR
jgi:hypothetical protein